MRREATVKEVAEFLIWICDNYPELADKKLKIPFDSGCCAADVDYPIFAFTEETMTILSFCTIGIVRERFL